MSVRVIRVIEETKPSGCGGSGVCRQDHPHEAVRLIKVYHTLKGEPLAWSDPMAPHVYSDPKGSS